MTRISELQRDQVPEALRGAFDTVIQANRGGRPIGPGAITIHSPEMAARRTSLSAYMRSEISVPQRIQEVTILVTARALDCPYVWHAHVAMARQAGVAEAMIKALRENLELPTMPIDEHAIARYGLELMRDHVVREATFQAALDAFGTQHLVELTSLMGHYAQNVFLVNAFDVDLPDPGSEPRLPL